MKASYLFALFLILVLSTSTGIEAKLQIRFCDINIDCEVCCRAVSHIQPDFVIKGPCLCFAALQSASSRDTDSASHVRSLP